MKELKLRGIQTVEGANELLEGGFIEDLNRKFAKEPRSSQDAHAPLCGIDLESVLVWTETRQLQNDWTIDFQGKPYQILDPKKQLRAKQRIEVRVHLDGQISLHVKEKAFDYLSVEKPKPLSLVREKKEDSYLQKRLAGYQGKQASPWNQFNPAWLKGNQRRSSSAYD